MLQKTTTNLRGERSGYELNTPFGKFTIRADTLHRYADSNLNGYFQTYLVPVSSSRQKSIDIVRETYEELGHLGRNAVKISLQRRWWIPKISNIIDKVIAKCPACQSVKPFPESRKTPL